MEGKNLSVLIAAFVMIILGVALIGTIAVEGNKHTLLLQDTNVSFDISGARVAAQQNISEGWERNVTFNYVNSNQWKQGYGDCNIKAVSFINASGTAFTENTDFNLSSVGVLSIQNSSAMRASVTNTTALTYTYCPDEYLTQSWQRTVLNLVPGFFGIAILLIGVGLMYVILRNEGILDKI